MKNPTKNILESHPNELISPLVSYLKLSWEGVDKIDSLGDRAPLEQLVYDSFINGWMNSINSYKQSSIELLDAKISKRTKELEEQAGLNNQNDLFGDEINNHVSIDELIRTDALLSKLRQLNQKISRELLAQAHCKNRSLNRYNDSFQSITNKVKGLNLLCPIHYSEIDHNSLSPLTISEQLNQEKYKEMISNFEGFVFEKRKNSLNFAEKVSPPVVAWEFNEQNIPPSMALYRAIFDYGSEARESYNHYQLIDKIKLIESGSNNQSNEYEP